ncbi:MAG: RDD family protein [Phycisphaeraceae bacterium]
MIPTKHDNQAIAATPWLACLITLAMLLITTSISLAGGQTADRAQGRGEQEAEFETAETLVAGSEQMLFVVQLDPDLDEFRLRFAEADALDALISGWRASGMVEGLAAWNETAYLIYSDHSVQAMRWRGQEPMHPRPFEVRQLPPLPGEGQLLDVIATSAGELVVVMGPEEATAGDEAPRPRPTTFPTTRESDSASVADDSDGASVNVDLNGDEQADDDPLRLLRLSRNQWHAMDWPDDLAAEQFVGLGRAAEGRVTLLSRSADGSGVRFDTWRPDQPNEGWQREQYAIEPSSAMRSLRVLQTPLLLRSDAPIGPIDAYYTASSGLATHLGQLEQLEDATRWWATPTGNRVTLIVADENQSLARWQWDPRGQMPPAAAVEPIEFADMPALTFEPIVWLLIAAMAVALLMLLATMGNAEANVPRLPASLRPAGTPRIWAAFIDFAPALGVSMLIFGVSDPLEVLRAWPSLSGDWDQMPPAITAICLHALHTLLAELFTGRSLGKWIMGCRVVNLTGEPPHAGQIVGRNFFKILEMAVPWLLLLPILPSLLPYQQRLGDLIGRTLVVVDVPESEQPPAEKREDDDESQKHEDG